MIERLLSTVLEERFEEEDLKDCFIVDIVIKPHDRFEVYIDSDSHLSLERCQKVSRYLERKIEENEWAGEKYVLEVSSPGLDRPLKLARQYKKNVGRTVKITTKDDEVLTGVLEAVADSGISLNRNGKSTKLEFDDIKKTLVQVSFKKK